MAALQEGYRLLHRDYRVGALSPEALQEAEAADPTPPRAPGRLPGGTPPARARSLAYLAARLPATYAALEAAWRRIPDAELAGCVSLLDLGSGPGSATWSLADRLEGLREATLVDRDAEALRQAEQLAPGDGGMALRFLCQDLDPAPPGASADLVALGYVLTELPAERRGALLEAAWAAAGRGVLLVEPGTPEGAKVVAQARALWSAAGGRLVAPCPQAGPCPLAEGAAWCHFGVRLERRGLHRQIKGGTLGYEDEKFAWLFVSKRPDGPVPAPYRLHAHPRRLHRHLELDVCDADGKRRTLFYSRRTTPAPVRQAARRLAWGDAWDPERVPDAPPDEDAED